MAEKRKQLGNVAFGGPWTERLLAQDRVGAQVGVIERAAEECADRDVRSPELDDALGFVRDEIEKGTVLAAGFMRALEQPNPGLRQRDARRLARQIRLWAGV